MGDDSSTVRRLARRATQAVGGRLIELGRRVYRAPQERRVAPWFAADGDHTLRLNYDLRPQSLVLDLGGYEGQWASDIFAMYRCKVHVFEPFAAFAERISRRFARNDEIVVHPFGLAAKSERVPMYYADNGTSMFPEAADGTSGRSAAAAAPPSSAGVEVPLMNAADFFREHGIDRVDLMKINIEGGEYDLLEHLIDSGLVSLIRDCQVQFHDFVPDAQARMLAIQKRLAATHTTTYQYPFVWENWRLKDT